jgi:Tfp pilus assembly protein PilV
MRPRNARSGITLVEVLVASVVVGAGLATVLSAISASVRADVFAENRVKAAHLIELQLGRIEGSVLPVAPGSGDFLADGEDNFTYTIAVDDADLPNLQQITVTVQWNEQGTPRTLSAIRLLFNDPDAQNLSSGGGNQAGSLMGSNGSGPNGSAFGSGSTGNSGSAFGGNSGGNSGSAFGSGSSGSPGSAFGSGGTQGSSFGGGGTP